MPQASNRDRGVMDKQASNKILITVIGLVVASLLISGVILAFRDVPELDPSTPEGAVQGYVQAIVERDDKTALEFLHPDLREKCEEELSHQYWREDASQVRLIDVRIDGNEARIEIEIENRSDPMSSWSHNEIIDLELIDGSWLIVRDPWPAYFCD